MNLTAVIKPIRYVTAKIGTGGGQGRSDHEVVTAEVAPDENVSPHYIDALVGKYYKTSELPVVFTTTGTSLTDWKIYGNEDGLGDYTGADLYSGTLEQGRIYDDSGALDSSDTRIRTDGYFATLQAGTYRFDATKSSTADSAALRACLYAYDNNGNYIGYFPSDWSEFPFQVSLPAANYKIMISYTGNGTITPAHVSDVSCIPAGSDVPTITDGYSIPVTVKGDNVIVDNLAPKTVNGITVTRNNDGSVTFNGTATAATNFFISNNAQTVGDYYLIDRDLYYIDGSPEGAAVYKYIMSYRYINENDDPSSLARVPYGGGVLDNTNGDRNKIAPYITVWSGITCNQVTFFPSLRKMNTVTFTVNHPLGESDYISNVSTGTNISTYSGENILSVDTAAQPSEVYLHFQT